MIESLSSACALSDRLLRIVSWSGIVAVLLSIHVSESRALPSADKLQLLSFTMVPAQPRPGQAVTVRVEVQNVGGRKLSNVQWQITLDNELLAIGSQGSVEAGSIFNATARWTATAGTHRFHARIDPDNHTREPENDRRNNTATLDLNVSAGPRLVQRVLDPHDAARCGALFQSNPEGGMCDCSARGVGVRSLDSLGPMVVFEIGCHTLGGKANPKAFVNFRLKNGWVVKSIEEIVLVEATNAGWRWVTRPNPGGVDPLMQLHLWSNPDGNGSLAIRIHIEGPEGTNPY